MSKKFKISSLKIHKGAGIKKNPNYMEGLNSKIKLKILNVADPL